MRLFPVPWQWFWRGEHPKYQVIDLEVTKHDKDPRPESHRPDLATVRPVEQLGGWPRRATVLNTLPQPTMCELVAARGWERPSLALVVPDEVTGLDWEPATGADHERKMNRAAQGSLLAQGAPHLEFCPWTFRYRYRCLAAGCRGHHQMIADWELSEAWRRWRNSYPDDYLDRIRDKWMSVVAAEKKPVFFVGNQQHAPQAFMVLGVARGVRVVPPPRAGPSPPAARRPRSGDMTTDRPRSTAERLFDP